MTRRRRLRPLVLPAALALTLSCLVASAGAAEPLRIATGGVTGVYHALGSAFCRLLEPDLPTRLERCVVLSSEGSLDNLRLLRAGAVELALAQAPLVKDAVEGSGPFAGEGPAETLRVLFAPLVETLAIVVRADGPVVQLEDLGGRRIDLGPPGSGSRATVMRLVESAGIDPEAFLSLASPNSALSADTLCRGISDAFASVGASPNSVVQEALTACPTRLVPVAGPIVERFLAGEADYRAAEIGPADYRQLDRPVATVRTPALLVADAGLPDETAYRLTATVLGRLSELRRLHLAFTGIEAAGLLAGCPPAPYHPGALAAFADAGLALPPCL